MSTISVKSARGTSTIPVSSREASSDDYDSQIITRIEDLLDYLQLSSEPLKKLHPLLSSDFPLRVPMAFAKRIKKADPKDPLLRQVLPLEDEKLRHPDFISDPVEDLNYQAVPGLIHKYPNRALLIATGICGIHCRYCFRREFPYPAASISDRNLDAVINYLLEHPSIEEIILSGGDPLTLSNRRLGNLLQRLSAVPHLKKLRIHSRQAIVMPSRINKELLVLLTELPFKACLVLHCNHANEIDQSVINQLSQLKTAGILLLNQSVILKGVNDNVEALCDLSQRLYDAGALPYYINALDRVQGSVHFLVEDEEAIQLVNEMRKHLPGYLVPRLVKDIPGRQAKTLLA